MIELKSDSHSDQMTRSQLKRKISELEERLNLIEERLWCSNCQVPRGGEFSDRDIKRLIEEGRIKISPLPNLDDPSILGTCKVDFHLGAEALILKSHRVSSVDFTKPIPVEYFDKVDLQKEGEIHIPANTLVIATTLEALALPDDIIARMEGKSSIARRGGAVHQAPLFDAGWDGKPMMELHNIGGVTATAHYGQPICAFSFAHLSSPTLKAYAARDGVKYSIQQGAKV